MTQHQLRPTSRKLPVSSLQKSLQQEWQFLQQVTKNVGPKFEAVQLALSKVSLPTLFVHGCGNDDPWHSARCLPVKCGLAWLFQTPLPKLKPITRQALCSAPMSLMPRVILPLSRRTSSLEWRAAKTPASLELAPWSRGLHLGASSRTSFESKRVGWTRKMTRGKQGTTARKREMLQMWAVVSACGLKHCMAVHAQSRRHTWPDDPCCC